MIVYMDGILKVVENWGRGHPQIGQKKKKKIFVHIYKLHF